MVFLSVCTIFEAGASKLLTFGRKNKRFILFFTHLIVSLQAETFQTLRIMAITSMAPAQGQILVNINDMSLLKDIKRALSLMRGVGKITVPRRQRMSSYERSLRDLEEGKVYDYDSLDDLIKEIEG